MGRPTTIKPMENCAVGSWLGLAWLLVLGIYATKPKLVTHLFLNCTGALCCSFFCPKTCPNNLFSRASPLLPFCHGLLTRIGSDEETLVFQPHGVHKRGMVHHYKCTKEVQQMEMDCMSLGRKDQKKQKLHDSFE